MPLTTFLRRRGALALLALPGLCALATGAAQAQPAPAKFPTQPLRLLVGNPPGGTTDVIGRLVAQKMSDTLGQPVVVENRPGASGLIAADGVAKAPADGYTLLMAPSQLATFRALYPGTSFDPEKDLAPVGLVATTPYVMVVHPSLPVKSLQELVAYAKAHPGQINYAGSTPGGTQHLSWELIKRSTGTDMLYVPYKGTAALMPDLLAGRLQAGIDNIAVLTPYVKSGQLRGIAVTSPQPTPLLPGVPTVAASGVPGFQGIGWFGVFTGAKVPAPVLDALRAALAQVMAAPDMVDKLVALGAESRKGSADEMRDLLKSEVTTWTKVIKDAGITVQ